MDTDLINWVDIVVVILYFAAVMGVGLWSSCRNRGSVGGYFLAGRSMHWIPVGASLFASNIGSGHFIGLAGSGAASGIGISVFELNAIFILMILGWLFVPVYVASGVFTMPEYLKKRFGGQRIRVYLAVLALLLYIFTKISADLYAGAVFIEQSLNISLYPAVIILLAISAMFTILGGLTAVIWTDFIQTVIMIIGAFWLMIASFSKVGGYDQVINKFFEAIPNTTLITESLNYTYSKCGFVTDNALHLIKPITDDNLPWVGVMFGLTISSIWYWCSDQVIVQRALAAKNIVNAKAGTLLAGYLKLLPMWLLVYPGMVARILFPDTVACADPEICQKVCGKERGCSDIAYPSLVLNLMPHGAKGLMLAVMVASLVSSLTSIFNSSSTIFTIDIWKRIRKNANDMELMIVGRVFVLLMVAVGIVWIPIVQSGTELFHYIQAITSFLAPPVCAVYILAVFWPRCNEQGAFWSLMIGLVVGLVRFIWEYSYTPLPCGRESEDKAPSIIKDVHYLHFGIILFGVTLIACICISILTKPIHKKHLVRLMFWNRHSKAVRVDLEVDETKPVAKADLAFENNGYVGSADDNMGTAQDDDRPDLKWYRRAFNWVCGIEDMQEEPQFTAEQIQEMEKKQTDIHEDKTWSRVVNVNAIILMTIAIFVWVFFA